MAVALIWGLLLFGGVNIWPYASTHLGLGTAQPEVAKVQHMCVEISFFATPSPVRKPAFLCEIGFSGKKKPPFLFEISFSAKKKAPLSQGVILEVCIRGIEFKNEYASNALDGSRTVDKCKKSMTVDMG